MWSSAYKKIFFIKIVLGVFFLVLFLLWNYHPKKIDRMAVHKLIFVVDNLPFQEELLQEEKDSIVSVLDFLDREGIIGEYSFALVSTAGSGVLELPFVENEDLFRQYVDALEIDTNGVWQDGSSLQSLLSSLDADKIIVMSSFLSDVQWKDNLVFKWVSFGKDWNIRNTWVVFLFLVLFILFI